MADESSSAVERIGEMVKEVQNNTISSAQRTVELIENISAALEDNPATQEASAFTQEQSATIHQIAESAKLLVKTSDDM